MSILSTLSVKPLLCAIGALVLVVAGMSAALFVQGTRVDLANSGRDLAKASQLTTVTEREAWKARADELSAANAAYGVTTRLLQDELKAAQEQAMVIRTQAAESTAIAQREAAAAERTLHEFTTRYQVQSRVADCARAMQQVGAVCPNFVGY